MQKHAVGFAGFRHAAGLAGFRHAAGLGSAANTIQYNTIQYNAAGFIYRLIRRGQQRIIPTWALRY